MVVDSPTKVALELMNGTRLQALGDLAGAVACFRTALTLDPKSSAAYNNLGNIFAKLGDLGTALTFYQAALIGEPTAAALHNNVANLHFKEGRLDRAVAGYKHAIGLCPDLALYHNNLGNALLLSERIPEAATELTTAIRLKPDYADAHVNLGFAFVQQALFDDAEISYRTAIEIDDNNALAHHYLGHLLLRKGNFREGWSEYEWRWKCDNFSSPPRSFNVPQWPGEPIAGQRLIVHAEQGFGDTIQFLRYVPLLAERGIQVILEVHPELMQVAAILEGVFVLLSRGDLLPTADWQCPLLSLPLAFNTQLDTIPAGVPYLKAPSPFSFLEDSSPRKPLRVGLVWRSNPKAPFAQKRSLPLEAFWPFANLPDIHFYCLQFCPTQQELEKSPIQFRGSPQGYGEMQLASAIIPALDLIITVDTFTAHLAGALGVPVWILLPRIADWRWLLDRDDSPWYPTAKLYRQPSPNDWSSVMTKVAADLAILTTV